MRWDVNEIIYYRLGRTRIEPREVWLEHNGEGTGNQRRDPKSEPKERHAMKWEVRWVLAALCGGFHCC